MLLPEVLERYEEEVLGSGTVIYDSESSGSRSAPIEAATERFDLGGVQWEMRVRPAERIVRQRLGSDLIAFWTLGGLFALGAGGLVGSGTFFASALRSRIKTQGAVLHQTREQLDGAMRQLLQAEKMTALGELVAGVAHEINNPLTTMMGYSKLALAQKIPPNVRIYMETVFSEAERAGRIVRSLLTFARKHPPEKQYIGLNGIIEKTLELKAYHFRTSQIELETDLATDLPMTMVDFHQIQQVLLNLLDNAGQAIAESKRSGRIRISTSRKGDRIEVRVSDNGLGIPPRIQNRIFEPFFTTKKEGKGAGLGLSVCYGLIQEHGGELRVESDVGLGATFIVLLPIVEAAALGVEAAPAQASDASAISR